ncbi:MAG TPA: Wzz/FepE/Etk N-terminal domain-containing protein [Longimicrobium sp.]|jgi:hypothetical protein|uniref:Wzz/FepE/Etk N-terminal domain-containing protein n=1 Tax=Longimicrobium sp. TaxID=2029185 RepID=UPI002ED82AE7
MSTFADASPPVEGRVDAREPGSGGFAPLHLAAVLLRRWKLVAGVALLTTLAAAAASLVMPKRYVAGTLMVPFAAAQGGGGLNAQLPSGVASLLGGLGGAPSDRILGVILTSRTLADSVTQRVARTPEQKAVVGKIVAKGVRVQRGTDGSVRLQVSARDPRLAATIANAYPAVLNELMAQVSADAALRRQQYLERQVATARDRLVAVEDRVVNEQRRRATPDAGEQARQTLSAAAELQRQIDNAELEAARLRRTLAPGNPQLAQAEAALETRRAQLRRITGGRSGNPVYVPFGEGGEVRVAAARMERQLSQEAQVFQALTSALAEAQLNASNDLPVLTVLDAAQVPGPTGSLPRAASTGLMLGLVLGAAFALALHGVAVARRNPANAPFFAAWSELFGGARRGAARGPARPGTEPSGRG